MLSRGVRFAPGGIRKGAAGFDICFIHPKGNEELPIGGEGVLIELVQAPKKLYVPLLPWKKTPLSPVTAARAERGPTLPRSRSVCGLA